MNYKGKMEAFKDSYTAIVGDAKEPHFIETQKIIDAPEAERGQVLQNLIKEQSPELYQALVKLHGGADGNADSFFERSASVLAMNNSSAALTVDNFCLVALPTESFDEKREIVSNLLGPSEMFGANFNYDEFPGTDEEIVRWIAAHEAGHVINPHREHGGTFVDKVASEVHSDDVADKHLADRGNTEIAAAMEAVRAINTILFHQGGRLLEDEHATAGMNNGTATQQDIDEIRIARDVMDKAVAARMDGKPSEMLTLAPDVYAKLVREEILENRPEGMSDSMYEKIAVTVSAMERFLLRPEGLEEFDAEQAYGVKPRNPEQAAFDGDKFEAYFASAIENAEALKITPEFAAASADPNVKVDIGLDASNDSTYGVSLPAVS